ncbi:MAG: 16S rRNA (guanine(527)-N(7))-methyltransferase RsmG [Nocardiopsaceae bacterium]|nr:16S rRNA (guanine(527)-N(7))-methyltransferase RsmG [Nocardiopsaceae bacterium]
MPASPTPPPEADGVFGAVLGQVREYAELLATEGTERGLIGPRETGRLWERHLLNCAVVDELLPDRGELVDIGSGAGLPGLVLAMMRPSLTVVLMDSMLRRCVFLDECAGQLGLENVRVVRGRADELAGSIRADVATARAVAPLDRLAGWAAGLLRPGGELLAIKGESAERELAEAKPVLRRLDARSAEVLRAGHGRVVPATTIVRVVITGRGREERADARRSRPGVA